MNIYVGNLSYNATEDGLKELFGAYGEVKSAKIIMDKFTGRSRGFGFVEMGSTDAGQKAIGELDGKDWEGRTLRVREANPPAR